LHFFVLLIQSIYDNWSFDEYLLDESPDENGEMANDINEDVHFDYDKIEKLLELNTDQIFLGMMSLQYRAKLV
jgi:hypothetical protein